MIPAFLIVAEWVWYVLIGGLIIGAVVGIQAWVAHRRTQALIPVAPEIGFVFEGKTWSNPQFAPPQTAIFNQGHAKEFRNVMTGSANGFRASLFDYGFTVGHGRYARNYKQTLAAYSKAGANLPSFKLQSENLAHKIWDALTHKDINFESHPKFSGLYQLSGADEVRLRHLFSPALLSHLEQLDKKKKWRIEGMGDTLIIYRFGKKTKPVDYRGFLEESSTLAGEFFAMGNCS